MYCVNCGNKVNDNAYVCVNCGVIVGNNRHVKSVRKCSNSNITGIVSIAISIISLVLSLSCFFRDISSVGMYTDILDRFNFATRFVLIPFVFMFLSLIFALKKKSNICNRIGLGIALTSAFLIITEVMVIIIY